MKYKEVGVPAGSQGRVWLNSFVDQKGPEACYPASRGIVLTFFNAAPDLDREPYVWKQSCEGNHLLDR
jgi:hypothetical protein